MGNNKANQQFHNNPNKKRSNRNRRKNFGNQSNPTNNEPIYNNLQDPKIRAAAPTMNQINMNLSSSNQQIHPSFPGQQIRPGKPVGISNPTNTGNPGLCITSIQNQSNQQPSKPIPSQELGPKFKPLQTVEKSQLMANINTSVHIPTPTGEEISMLQNTDSPIITLVGKGGQKKTISANQQKKILKFQMKMVTMQQEKMRQMKAIQESSQQIEPATFHIFDDPNFEVSNPAATAIGVQTPVGIDKIGNAQNPSGMHNFINNTEMQEPNRSHITPGFSYPKGIPRSFLLQQQGTSQSGTSDRPIWPSYQMNPIMIAQPVNDTNVANQLTTETKEQDHLTQPYSPSELYLDLEKSFDPEFEDSVSSEPSPTGQKRLSAFKRLGPQTQPKKPKLTISVTVNDDQAVREVVDETEEIEEIRPVHLREDIILSTDETVMKYLKAWPWKKNVVVKKTVTARNSKTVMMLEKEQMEEIYSKSTLFLQVTVTGYPSSWKKEHVLDTLMENIRGYSFIPCFIEFNVRECKFLTLRCRSALLSLHKCGFIIRKDNVELTVTIAQTELTLNQLDFVPRLVLRKILSKCSDVTDDKEAKLNLSGFTLKEDVSHFIYFPLNRMINQMEIIEMQSEITWNYITNLNLSHNRIDSLDGFDLEQSTPKLKHLDLSYNCFEKITSLLKIRQLPLKTIHLEGNPLCRNYTDPDQYVKALKMIFSSLNTIDGIPIRLKGEMPKFYRNYCPADAKEVADRFLDVYFPLLDGDIDQRELLDNMYESNANVTITYSYKLAFSPVYRTFKSLFVAARNLEQGNMDMVKGSKAIVKTISNWPQMEHDPLTFTVDVIYHTESVTIIRVDGILKLTRESLADEEFLLAFSRTVVLHTRDGVEYKIQAETLYWSSPVGKYAESAFSIATVRTNQPYPKIESTTDEKVQEELLNIFMKLTTMNKKISERCLELKKWNLREALDHFVKLWKLDALESLTKEVS